MFIKIEAINIKIGNILLWNNKLHLVTKRTHTKPGKGPAYIQLETKELISKLKSKLRFRSNENIKKARIEEKKYQFLYTKNEQVILMDKINFAQISISKHLFGTQFKLLDKNMEISIEMYNKEIIATKLPEKITVKIESCEYSIKNQRFTSSNKPAFIKNNIRIMVPQFIKKGDFIVIKSHQLEYFSKEKI